MSRNILRSFLAPLMLAFFILSAALTAGDGALYFVQLTDTHVGYKDAVERLPGIVESVNKLALDLKFVAITGDITDKNGDEENARAASEIFSRLKAPVYVLSGNHDIKAKSASHDAAVFGKGFGKFCNSAEYDGVVMIFYFSEPLRKDYFINGYNPAQALREKLEAAGKKPVIIFTHVPPAPDFDKNSFHELWPPEKLKEFGEIIKPYNIKAIICGHLHRDDFYWFNNVPVFICPPVTDKHGNPSNLYRIYIYENGKISYTTRYVKQKNNPREKSENEQKD